MFASLRRIIPALLLALALTAPLGAQEATPEPEPTAPAATPEPLPTRGPRPRSFAITNDDRAALQFFFENVVPQGQTRLARVVGDDIVSVRADWLGGIVDFWPADDGSFYGLLSADMETPPANPNPLTIAVTYRDGTRSTLDASAPIVRGSFINQSLSVPAEKGHLLDPVTERGELARIGVVAARATPDCQWDSNGFILPVQAALTASFGVVRTFNGTYRTRHTGWDIRVVGGQPVGAMAAGTVVMAEALPIRGNYVFIDHGCGVYSGYAHLDEVYVSVGHRVDQGSVVGTVGSNGRSSGPHFHWETAVNGVWVDSVQLLEMWMP
jgi:hypothetical protein